ncbi:hypothetical protein C8J57DRAFT_1268326 [Mycena rebaudengoi]|nr:hypothetical protein C8J57DRAFT_1268326 [Mycena rebaudengoi]
MAPSWWGMTLLAVLVHANKNSNSDFLEQSFFFDYYIASQTVPVPVTTQCETIHLNWGRGAGTGPDPTAPYYLHWQVYTSAFAFPFVVSAGSGLSFDWGVPFEPDTLYQICMFDKNGNSGGCQDIYTVIANTTTPSCNNATFPPGSLEVDVAVNSGASSSLSQYGWVDQCSDIQVTPKNGTPPYTFTIAPTLHSPQNVTGVDQSPMNWTVNLSWGSSFFLSVVDSEFNFWSWGPLHSGKGSTAECLSANAASDSEKSPSVTVASGIGGLVLGLIAGIAGANVFLRQRQKRTRRERGESFLDSSYGFTQPYFSGSGTHYKALGEHAQDPSSSTALQRLQRQSSSYELEPFTLPVSHPGQGSENQDPHHVRSPTAGGGNVDVVHHDTCRAPITAYHREGAEVVELPPQYAHDSSTSDDERLSERPTSTIFSPTSFDGSALLVSSSQRRPNRTHRP